MISRRQFLQAGGGAFIAAGSVELVYALGLVLPAAAGVPAEAVAMYCRASVLSRKLCRNRVIRR